jgi:transcriptional regulator with XRE-family HTH domain
MTDTSTPALVRSARMALGLTQQQLGEQLGYISRTAELMIQSIESGRRKVPRDRVKALAGLLHLDPMRLL